MPINADKPQLWKADVAASVDLYNDWFMRLGPKAYRETRIERILRHGLSGLRSRRGNRLGLGASYRGFGDGRDMMREILQRVEVKRQAEQAKLDSLKNARKRNEMGQYATPFSLALEIVKFVRDNWLSSTKGIRFLDPALGTGAFFSALLHAFSKERIESAVGVELDSHIASVARDLWGTWGLEISQADFTRLPFPASPQANLLIANPPYVRHHHLDKDTKQLLQQRVQVELGLKLSGLAGLYCYFLLLAHHWLADDGIGVWLIPSEFMDVNYGSVVKHYLAEQVTLHHVHRFDSEDVQFDDALVSSAVLVFQKLRPSAHHETTFSLGGMLSAPRQSKSIAQRRLADVSKWTSAPNVYLMLYPAQYIQQAAAEAPHLLDELFQLLKRASHDHLRHEGRTYGGGLNKIEPKELARVPLPDDALLEQVKAKPRQLALLERQKALRTTRT